MVSELNKIKFYKQSIIRVEGGDIYHVIKKSNHPNFQFGEAYFSFVDYKFIKGWKLHKKMISNFCVPKGEVEFVFVSKDFKDSRTILLGEQEYGRLYVPPNIWYSFKGISKTQSLILNLSSIEHDENEIKKINLEDFPLKINI